MLRGVDLSYWQSETPPLDELDFVMVRATYNVSADTRYAMHAANVRAAGRILGAYHFGTGRTLPELQAGAFLATIGPSVRLVALDLESDPIPMTAEEAAAWIRAVQSSGRKVGLYHSASGFPALGQDWDWIAAWDVPAPPAGADMWQSRGAPLDLDTFLGDAAALAALGGAPPMRVFTITGPSGTATVLADAPHWAPTLDGINPYPALTAGQAFANALPIELAVPVPGGLPGENRSDGYLVTVGGLDCILLGKDASFAPADATALAGELAAAQAKIAAAQAALA